ncbi:hypothetical protein PybrP1_001539 [[Pythium] brassicae (nom. inval.)]|nr:hypothetical protein PybrP1_001539 [[Pythium] brassicae (nom. inval.)]
MGERVESMNVVPAMFRAGISAKFTTRRGANFHDTTLAAASAAKQRAERRAEKQADAIDKQQQKIEGEMKKIEAIARKVHRRQVREARRLRGRLHFAATRIQRAFRRSRARWRETQTLAATRIQCRWRVRVYASRLLRAAALAEHEYAATRLQSVARMAAAKQRVARLQQTRQRERARHRAATRIQSTARSFLTRLIYLDVLYVLSRIQAAVRGFLVRRRLQWVAAIDIEGVCRFQALARGFLARQALRRSRRRRRSGRLDKQRVEAVDGEQLLSASGEDAPEAALHREDVALRRHAKRARASAAAAKPPLPAEAAVKRSYWLPAGASFSKRLPVLAAKRPVVVDAENSEDGGGDEFPGSGLLHHRVGPLGARTPKKWHQRNRPPRLAPVVPLSAGTGSGTGAAGSPGGVTDAESERVQATQAALEDRHRREEELKQKLLSRRGLEKRKLELELRLKREHESEENERKLMEREEKLARLLLKVLHRRSKEGKIKKQSAEQQREERERIALAREERQTRLVLKLAASKKRSANASSVVAPALRVKASRSRAELQATGDAPKSSTSTASDPQDDDSDDMSFLDIDFKIPASMQRGKVAPTSVKRAKRKPSQEEIAVGDSAKSIGGGALREANAAVANEFEFDYGNEFEEVTDEAALGRLIC